MLRNEIMELLHREVVPAIGCTEPIAVALAVSKAREVLGEPVLTCEVQLSANVVKNSMGVGIPGTGMIGLPIAVALGITVGNSAYGLEVLKDFQPEVLEKAKSLIAQNCLSIGLKKDSPDKLYIEIICRGSENCSRVIICGSHTHIAFVSLNDEVQLDEFTNRQIGSEQSETLRLSFDSIFDFATQTPLEDLLFLKQAAVLNKQAAKAADGGSFGHSVGRTLLEGSQCFIMGDSIFSRIVAETSSACDVRMAGAMVPVMSNSGSGNQGITASLPVVRYAEETQKSEEELIRALALSNLLVIYIKRQLGRLSGLCGVMVAGIGSSAGITYLMGGSGEQISYAVKNMIGNITGVICDGAKPSCAMKVSNAVSSGVISAMMAMDNKVISSLEGIADDNIDKTIRNLTDIGSEGMEVTDKMVLEIMTGKK